MDTLLNMALMAQFMITKLIFIYLNFNIKLNLKTIMYGTKNRLKVVNGKQKKKRL